MKLCKMCRSEPAIQIFPENEGRDCLRHFTPPSTKVSSFGIRRVCCWWARNIVELKIMMIDLAKDKCYRCQAQSTNIEWFIGRGRTQTSELVGTA